MSRPLFLTSAAALAAAVGAVVGVGILASPALAHIDPDPTEAQAGATVTVGFTVEHGCESSPTVQLEMRLPEGVVDATPEPVDGWVESIEDDIVVFADGSLATDVEGTFQVTMTLPPTPDTTIYFPFVQRCEVGEIRWIAIPSEPGEELDEPAPAMDLIGPVVAPTVPATTAPPVTEPPTSQPSTTETPTTETPTTAPEPVATDVSSSVPVTSVASAGTDEDGSSRTGTIMFIASVAAVAVVGAIAYTRSRQSRSAAADGPPSSPDA